MKDFKGKTAVITGGASGIGFALAEQCADRQMNVVLADIEEEALDTAVKHFEERQVNVLGIPTNTMVRESVKNLFDKTIETFGEVHLLFNNAGVVNGGPLVPVWELPDVDWEWVIGVNFNGVLFGIQTFVPHMIEHGKESHIVNTASIAAFLPGSGPYGVSKHGVVILSEGLAGDLKGAKANVGVSVLCPGWVNTKIGDAERNRPNGLDNSNNPERKGLGINELLSASKSPAELAAQVFESIEENRFYILPHKGWDDVVTGHAEAIVAREGPYKFDMAAHAARREKGEEV